MISVFTPSHNPRYLDDCYRSLKEQTFEDWEWIVYLNSGATWKGPKDDRVFVVPSKKKMGVGEAKRRAVACCRGELLVELDHDDELTPKALDILWTQYINFPGLSLLYSDFTHIDENGDPVDNLFDPAMGWQQDGPDTHSFFPFPSAVSYIWYAPNHVRAIPRAAYDAVGGYDGTLDVLDDQDLMARLYQHGDFWWIPATLYRQRVHSEQTQVQADLNARIQTETVAMYDRNIEAIAMAWAKRWHGRCLDMGGAHNSPGGYETVDYENADIIGDACCVLEQMEDNTVGVIRCYDFLEHLHPSDVVWFMNQCYRVLRHGGMMITATPSTDGRGAFQDPTHRSFWNEHSFWYYTDANYAKYVPEIDCRFQVSRLYTGWPQPHIAYVYANLVAIKDGVRLPGELRI